MEWVDGPATPSGCPARKKRSNFNRRPHPNPNSFTNCLNLRTVERSPADYIGHGDMKSYKLVETDRSGNEKKLKKVKLKLGGITRTLHTKSSGSVKSSNTIDGRTAQQKENPYVNGVSGGAKGCSSSDMYDDGVAMNEASKCELGYKNKRVPRKHAVVEGSEEDDDDEEIRFLKKLRASKAVSGNQQEETKKKTKGIIRLMGLGRIETMGSGSPKLGKVGRKKAKLHEDIDHEVDPTLNNELRYEKMNSVEDFADSLAGSSQEMTMTTRKRALECPESSTLVEFPNGLPDAPSKKQKLSEVEQQLRKAEAAQRRRSQAEKAAKEAEAEAIRKILGQDSNRKMKEEKLKKQQEEMAQEKTDRAATLGPNTIRWIMGPNGTIVTFSDDVGLPKIFDSPLRYPPPREKCVGPNCKNEYKYRDSKSKLPLCSLHCYKAAQGTMELLHAC